MATIVYPARATGDRTSGYVATFPDLPGVSASGSTLAELLAHARESLHRHLEELTAEAGEWPPASDLSEVGAEGVGLLVDIEMEDAPVRVNISVGERLLKRIDQAAEARGMTRSGFIAAASRQMLGEAAPGAQFDARKVQESLSEYARTLQDRFGPESEFARNFHDFDRRLTEKAEGFALQVAAALRGKSSAVDKPVEESADTRA